MAKPYVALSHFHPALLRTNPPGDEAYAHDDNATYVIAQPFIFVNPEHPDRIDLVDYLHNWTAATLDAAGVGIIGEAEGRLLQEGKITAVPVPLPPDTRLRLHLKGATLAGNAVDWFDERVLTGAAAMPGADEYLLDGGADGWPGFAVLSLAQPMVEAYADLDGGAAAGIQKTAVFRSMLGHFSALVHAYGAGQAPPADARGQLWNSLVEPNYKDHPLNGDEAAVKWWKDMLDQPHGGGQSHIEWAYALLVRDQASLAASDGPALGVPRYHWSDQALGAHGDLFLKSGGAALGSRSYLHALWHTLRGMPAATPEDVAELGRTLGRLFGFGERLAWPLGRLQGPLASSKRFMPLRVDLAGMPTNAGWLHPERWFATNVPSLLGLVFRISPFDPLDPPAALVEVEFTVGAAMIANPSLLAKSMNDYFDALARDLATPPISVSAKWGDEGGFQSAPSTAAARIVMFAPREAPLGQMAAAAVPSGRSIHAVPEALLDMVDDKARFTPGVPGQLPETSEPRRGIFGSELLAHPELQHPSTRLWYRLPVMLVRRALPGLGGNAYAMTRRNGVHGSEQIVLQWLQRLADGGAPAASLWIPQAGPGGAATAEFAISAINVVRDADGALLIADPDPGKPGSLTKLIDASPDLPGATGAKTPLPYLVFAASAPLGDPFDLVEFAAPPQKLNIALALAAVSRLSMSSDRIAHSMALTWHPGFAPDGTRADGKPTPKVDHAADANKLRLQLAGPEKLIRKLSDPDAMLPLPRKPEGLGPRPWNRHGPVANGGPQAWYWLAEHFDHDRGGDAGKGEATRFSAWVRAGQAFALSGYVEHQLGHRVQLAAAPLADLRRSVDIALPTDLQAGTRPDSGPDQHVGIQLPFVVVREDGNALRVVLDKRPAAMALSLQASAHAAAGTPTGAERDPLAGLRALYRSLSELRDAMAAGSAEVVIESWRFDNAALVGSRSANPAGKDPTLAAGLVPDLVEQIALPLASATPGLMRLFAGLDQDFGHFVDELTLAVAASAGDELALLASTPIAPFSVHGSYLRAGLRLTRPAQVRAAPDWKEGAFIPVADTDSDPRAGTALADATQRELAGYLTDPDSRANSALGWAVPLPPADPALAGPGAPQFLRPSGDTMQVERVLDLFYMPHAFVLPRAHPAVGDRQATADFAGFLLGLVDDVLAARAVSDRIDLSPMADAAGAVAMRIALRDLLERAGGVADALMSLFVRVDVPALDPPAAGQQLHWHAARLLDALERIVTASERPRSAVRQLLVDQPALFGRARAIAIAPFNTFTAAPPADPAAAFNHSTFSTELFDFTIRKTLINDDDGRETDATRFSVADLRGETRNGVSWAYVLDVLPERQYDDTLLIESATFDRIDPEDVSQFGLPRELAEVDASQPGAAHARRGENVADPRLANGIAINVVHVFPNWRYRKAGRLHCEYLLPERRMPPRPRPVDGCLAAQPGTRAGHSTVSPAITGTMPRIDLMAQWSGTGGQPGAYQNAVEALGEIDIAAAERDDPRKAYRRIAPAASAAPDAALGSLPQARSDSPGHINGWHTLTAELSHFWFEIDLDKPGAKLVSNLDDNAYEVEVEMWSGVPPASTAPPEALVAADAQDGLLDAFRSWRAGRSGSAAGQAGTVPKLDPAKFAGLVERWLLTPPAGAPWDGQSLLEKAQAPKKVVDPLEQAARNRRFRISRNEVGGWGIREIDAATGASADAGLGAVAGFEILARPDALGNAPKYDDPVPLERLSALVRISVLDHPFHVSRARMRVMRNWRDVDGDNVPDIHPDLILAERYSDWVSELRQPVVLGPATPNWHVLPAASRQLQVVSAGSTQAGRVQEWLDKSRVPGATIDFGFALRKLLEAPAFIDLSDNSAVKGLWPASWMSHDDFSVDAVVRRTVPDTSFRYGEGLAVTRIAERDVDAPRQILKPVPAPELDRLLDQVRPAETVALEHYVVMTWRDREGVEVLRVLWPVVFSAP